MIPTRRHLWAGALLGGAAGLIAALFSQISLFLRTHPEAVFTGAPQGLDQWTYFSVCRAIWRSPNGFTYEYPYTLFWSAPAVLFQFPLVAVAWIGRVAGLPLAFELARIAGAAGSGVALAVVGVRMVRGRVWRWWFWIALVLGGGWFAWAAAAMAIETAGPDGLTEFWHYLPKAEGTLYWWAPFVAQNLRFPLECIYHALVFGALACLVARRDRSALGIGFVTWFSNPFTATALGAAVLPWWGWLVWERRGADRRHALRHLCGWALVTLAGWGYYGPFLGQWPVLRDLAEQYHVSLTPPLSPGQLLLLCGPWTLGLIWSVATCRGRRHVWGRPHWRLFGLLALSQLVLIQQGWLLGNKALQPFHFNRGYLQVGLVAVGWRAAMAIWRTRPAGKDLKRGGAYRMPKWALVLVLSTLGDQSIFLLHNVLSSGAEVSAPRPFAELVARVPGEPAERLIYVEAPFLFPSYVTAFSPHLAYHAPESMAVPFPEERERRLKLAMEGKNGGVVALGVDYVIVSAEGLNWQPLRSQGWSEVARRDGLILAKPPAGSAAHSVESRPAPVPLEPVLSPELP